MARTELEAGMYPALLKYWRRRKGWSQLDLALQADVSSRHISFLETGKAKPSREMILRLGSALGAPLRDVDGMLRAEGLSPEFEGAAASTDLPAEVSRAVDRMLVQQEPFPLVLMDRRYDIVRFNDAALRLLGVLAGDPLAAAERPLNGFRLLFDSRFLRDAICDWPAVARALLWRLHREALDRPSRVELRELLSELHALPGVPESWRFPDLTVECPPVFTVHLRKGPHRFAFLTTMTTFNAPQNVTLEELRIESYFPADDETARACAELARSS